MDEDRPTCDPFGARLRVGVIVRRSIVAVVAGIFLIVVFLGPGRKRHDEILSKGTRAVATVTNKRLIGGSVLDPEVRYHFQIGDRGVDGITNNVGPIAYNRLEKGAPITIAYLPSDPTISDIVPDSPWASIMGFSVGGGLLLIGGVAGLVWANRLARVRQTGPPPRLDAT